MNKKIYISGPISGKEDFNRKEFLIAQKILGDNCINPHDLHNGKTNLSWIEYMKTDIKALMDCDAILMLPGWEDSRGAIIEMRLAMDLGYKVFFDLSEAVGFISVELSGVKK